MIRERALCQAAALEVEVEHVREEDERVEGMGEVVDIGHDLGEGAEHDRGGALANLAVGAGRGIEPHIDDRAG
ncbi:MAG: hypothetical protein ACRELA_21370 [Candidatus Rokuibacteriota bacterium]